ncbi:MarR family winged helix-turn-helix transcriptional regulator [Pseudonocardia xishanensis]|uniref:HTH marR-type domain-containing protein n=1 Tax=Pseudonocardia xishanensis TaxID=630995 RepID=A0ABP8RJE5_9PSEU
MTSIDPTRESWLVPLKALLADMDGAIAELYARRGIAGVRPRFSMALIRLHHRGPLSVKELAAEVDVTHSAMSQTVSAMRREGLVESTPGPDARTRLVALTAKGADLVPFLEAEWRATEAAVAQLDGELPYRVTQVIADMAAALRERPFVDRISEQLR